MALLKRMRRKGSRRSLSGDGYAQRALSDPWFTALLVKTGQSSTSLAGKLGISKATMCSIMAGRCRCNIDYAVILAEVLDVDLALLVRHLVGLYRSHPDRMRDGNVV